MPFDVAGFFGWVVAVTVIVPLVIIALIVGLLVWSMRRRGAVLLEDPAVAELKSRYARGEIETAEYQVRLRELTGHD